MMTNKWGKWTYNPELNVITHDDMTFYEVDIDRMPTAAAMLDWIFQVTGKRWVSTKDAGDLIEALRAVVNPQSVLCGYAMNSGRVKAGG